MKPSTELFDLIRSLNKSEKRFFKLHSALQSGEKNYLKIFDAIDKQKVYDEDGLKQQFKRETFIKHFPSEKNHLYKLILKSLRAYHADSTVRGQLVQETKNIEILYRKALYKECNKFLHRAKRVASENERFYHWFELLSWEKMLLEEAYESGIFTKDLDALIAEEQEVIEKLRNLAAYHVLYSKINYVFRSGGYVRTPEEHAMVEEISEHPLIVGKNTALSDRAATICFYTQGFCYWAKRDWKLSYQKFQRVRVIMERNKALKKDLQKRYIRTLHYLINCEIELQLYKEAGVHIKEMRELTEKKAFGTLDTRIHVFTASYLSELRLMDRTGQHKKAVELTKDVIAGMERYGQHIHKEFEVEFYYALACVNFGSGEVNQSLFWLNKVLNDNETTLRQDIYTYARLFNLVIHYELGNNDLLEYIVRSTMRYLSKRHRDHAMEVLLIETMKKLARISKPEQKKEAFIQLRKELKVHMKDPNANFVLKYFDFMSWIEGHINGTTFSKAVQDSIRLKR